MLCQNEGVGEKYAIITYSGFTHEIGFHCELAKSLIWLFKIHDVIAGKPESAGPNTEKAE